MRIGSLLGICFLFLGPSVHGLGAQTEPAMLKPSGLEFPMVMPVGCPNSEACPAGRWRACDSLPILEAPGASTAPLAWLVREEAFVVETGASVVRVPGAVRVLEDTQQTWGSGREVIFLAGDTLYSLGHRGEGFFNAWYAGQYVVAEIFWPWYRGGGWEIRGEVLQGEVIEDWHRVATGAGRLGWIKRVESSLSVGWRDNMACPSRRTRGPRVAEDIR